MKHPSGLFFAPLIKTTFVLTMFLSSLCMAQESKLDISSIIHETQQVYNQDHKMVMAWWIPEQFWQASFATNPRLTQEQVTGFLKIVKPYTLIVVVKGEFGPFGGVTYEAATSIRTNLVLIDGGGNRYVPLDEADTGADMQNFLSLMKPLFANMLGSMGKNFDIFAFPANGKNARPIANALGEGSFSVQLGENTFKWRLPISSLLPAKICPKCGEKLSGAFKYCPFDGTPLEK